MDPVDKFDHAEWPLGLLPDSGHREEFDTGSRRDTREGKGRFDLLPVVALKAWAVRLEQGAVKYGERNWEKGQPIARYVDSALRHLYSYLDGDRSEDHLAAVLFNAGAIIYTEAEINAGRLPMELDDLIEQRSRGWGDDWGDRCPD